MNRDRKTHKTKRLLRENFPQIFALLVLCFGVGFLGFCAGKPISKFFKQITADKEEKPTSSVIEMEQSSTELSENQMTEESTSETTTTAVTSTTETTTTTTTTTDASIKNVAQQYTAYRISDEDMASESALKSALKALPEGCDTAILPMKSSGGQVNYISSVDGATGGAISLEALCGILNEAGVSAVAEISMTDDFLYPEYNYYANYFLDGTNDRWLDNKPEKGGKGWMCPYADATHTYLSDLGKELKEAGFSQICYVNAVYPHFYDTDLDYIGYQVSSKENRDNNMADLIMDIAKQVGDAEMLYCYNLYDAINQTENALRCDYFSVKNSVVLIDNTLFNNTFWYQNESYQLSSASMKEKMQTFMQIAKQISGDTVIPRLDSSSFGGELNSAIKALQELGYQQIQIIP